MSRRVFVTGAAGFIGGATVRILQDRGDQVVAVVRDPSKASDLDAAGTQVIAGDLGSETADPRGHVRLRRGHPSRRVVPSRHPGIRAAGDVRGERRAHGTRPRCRDLARHPAHRHGLDGQRLRQHPRPDRRREVPARPGRRVPELLRRDEVPGARRGQGPDLGRRADRHRHARRDLRGRRPFGDRRTARGRLPRQGAIHRPRRVRALADVRRRSRERGRRGDRTRSSGRELRPGRREHAPSGRDQDRRQGGRPSPAAPQPPDQPAAPVCPDRTGRRTVDRASLPTSPRSSAPPPA